mgnify:CR=1 FL=1
MALSDSAKKKQAEAQARWHKENLDRIHIAVPKGKREVYKALAAKRDLSLAGLITSLLDKEEKVLEVKFNFDGIDGVARLLSTEPNCHGNIVAEIFWGDLVMVPTFRSVESFIAFLNDDYELRCLIDEAAHTPDF